MTGLLIWLGVTILAVSEYLVFFYAPVEINMGLTQKIFYWHLPLAWWGLCSFLVVFISSIITLIKPKSNTHLLSLACAEIGELLAILTVITGMLWGRVAWGVWWTWDPRLTTAVVLCFIYAGYLILSKLDLPRERLEKICAICGILGFVDVPLVFMSARIWRSIHPSVFTREGAAMTHEMLITLMVGLVGMGLLWLALVRLRVKHLQLQARLTAIEQEQLYKHEVAR